MKKITKSGIYSWAEKLLPPVLFSSIKKTKAYAGIRSLAGKALSSEYKPEWHTISGGALKGLRVYLDSRDPWQKEMLSGKYDDFFFSYVDTLDLKSKVIFDVGAHIGFSSLYFSIKVGPSGRVIAFEPNPFNIERAKKILAENKFDKRVSLVPLALTDKEGVTDFVFSNDVDNGTSSGSFVEDAHTLRQKDIYEKKGGFSRMRVNTSTIDKLVINSKSYPAPDLIKIDIEGAEDIAIVGAIETIRRHRPILLIEIHSIYTMYRVCDTLRNEGYETKLLEVESDGRCFIAGKSKS